MKWALRGEKLKMKRAPKKNIAYALVKIFEEDARKMFDKKSVKIT